MNRSCRRLIYLHGFRSSPLSFKAQRLAEAIKQTPRSAAFVCPQLPASPEKAMELVLEDLQPGGDDVVVGSSLGGYYARYIAEHCDTRAVLLNPAIAPARSLAHHLGIGTQFHSSEPFEFRPEYLDQLQRYDVPYVRHPERCLLIAATGDEVLDWRDMVAAWQGARIVVIEGSDHGLSDFDQHIGRVLEFAGLVP